MGCETLRPALGAWCMNGAASFSTSSPARFSIAKPAARESLSASIRRSTRRSFDPVIDGLARYAADGRCRTRSPATLTASATRLGLLTPVLSRLFAARAFHVSTFRRRSGRVANAKIAAFGTSFESRPLLLRKG